MKKRRNDKRSFFTPLIVEDMGNKFKLFLPFTYYWKRYGITIQVPKGFISDFASIPAPLRLFIPKLGLYNKAAVLHDWVYQNHVYPVAEGYVCEYTRADADLLFLDAMTDLKVKKWKRYAMYKFVRLFGWLAWRKR